MTDKPHTLSIDQTEWRVLFASNIARVTEFVNGNTSLTPDTLKAMHDHLDRAKLLASAWYKSAPAVTPEVKAADVPAMTNGAAIPKKRRGRPSNAEVAARTHNGYFGGDTQ